MSKSLIMVTNITQAMKGKSILLRNGIRADIVRTPNRSEMHSCGYSIYVPYKTDEAEKILNQYGVKIIGRTERVGGDDLS